MKVNRLASSSSKSQQPGTLTWLLISPGWMLDNGYRPANGIFWKMVPLKTSASIFCCWTRDLLITIKRTPTYPANLAFPKSSQIWTMIIDKWRHQILAETCRDKQFKHTWCRRLMSVQTRGWRWNPIGSNTRQPPVSLTEVWKPQHPTPYEITWLNMHLHRLIEHQKSNTIS